MINKTENTGQKPNQNGMYEKSGISCGTAGLDVPAPCWQQLAGENIYIYIYRTTGRAAGKQENIY